MGKHIIRATRWSFRSLLSAYSRLMTLLFALFCAATGLLPKSASAKNAADGSTVFKGTAYRAADSTVLGNIRLLLTDCYLPDYGIVPDYGVTPLYGVYTPVITTLDTVETDENGTFDRELTGSGSRLFNVTSDIVDEPTGQGRYYTSTCVAIESETDSIYSLYLRKIPTTAVERKSAASTKPSAMTAFRGKELQIRLPEGNGQNRIASIVNSRGQETATLASGPDGMLRWDTRSVAKGIYFLRLKNGQTNLHVKILVK
ncbi:MAG: T9SS type A sorting domain-containing protein [Chitinispirillaceae bacterium]|nr:T9SS type A sorting domain-containing protein [Chitinispirillaceae bacterium]